MDNMNTVIKNHNKSIMNEKPQPPPNPCDCNNKNSCHLSGNCQVKPVIYKATVTTQQDEMSYIGLYETTSKSKWSNHKSSFNLEHKRKETELSKYIMESKRQPN